MNDLVVHICSHSFRSWRVCRKSRSFKQFSERDECLERLGSVADNTIWSYSNRSLIVPHYWKRCSKMLTWTYLSFLNIPLIYTYSDCLLFIWDLHSFTQNPNVHTCTLVIRLSGILLGHVGVSMTKEYSIPKTMGSLRTSSNPPSIFQQLQIHLFPTIYLLRIIKHKYQLLFMLCCTQIPAPHTYFLCFRSFYSYIL